MHPCTHTHTRRPLERVAPRPERGPRRFEGGGGGYGGDREGYRREGGGGFGRGAPEADKAGAPGGCAGLQAEVVVGLGVGWGGMGVRAVHAEWEGGGHVLTLMWASQRTTSPSSFGACQRGHGSLLSGPLLEPLLGTFCPLRRAAHTLAGAYKPQFGGGFGRGAPAQ